MSTNVPTRATRRHRLALPLLTVVAAGLLAGGCGRTAAEPSLAPTVRDRPVATAAPAGTETGPAPTNREQAATPQAEVVRPAQAMVAFAEADIASQQRTIDATTELGSPTALLVTERRDGWVRVLLPGRPTGATAWLRDQGLEIRPVPTEIRVDLAARTLTLLEAGRTVLTTPVAVGAPETPTPTGRFSVTDKLDTQDPGGAYGRYAVGLSGRSEVLTEFAGGDGQIGIHGTDRPDSIGQAVSHGCIRVPNEVMERLNQVLPLGTPVVVS